MEIRKYISTGLGFVGKSIVWKSIAAGLLGIVLSCGCSKAEHAQYNEINIEEHDADALYRAETVDIRSDSNNDNNNSDAQQHDIKDMDYKADVKDISDEAKEISLLEEIAEKDIGTVEVDGKYVPIDIEDESIINTDSISPKDIADTKSEYTPDEEDVKSDDVSKECNFLQYNSSYQSIDGKCCKPGSNGGLICIIEAIELPTPTPYGLTHCLGYLWSSDFEESAIYKLSETGEILETFASPGPYPLGLACDGEFIWNVDNETLKAYKLKLNEDMLEAVYAVDLLKVISPKGLTFLDEYLFCTNSGMDIHKVDPETGDTVSSIGVMFTPDSPVGLANDGKNLFITNNYWNSPENITIMTPTGEFLNSFDNPTSYPQDLTWDGQYLWYIGYGYIDENWKDKGYFLLKLELID